MNKDKHQAAMDALSELMRSELDSDARSRFACVNRLAVLAQKLQVEMNPRPEDADQQLYGNEVGDFNVQNHMALVGGGMHGGDQAQMAREMLAMLGPAMSGLQGNTEAKKREAMARELNEVIAARQLLRDEVNPDLEAMARLTDRINVLIDRVSREEEQEKPHAPEQLHVVPALGLRRPQAGEARGQDAPDARRAVPDGEGGGEGALPAGDEAGGLQEGVGV